MKAIVRPVYGSPDLLELREIDKPVPKDHQVLVRVRAASVNPVDWHFMRGTPLPVRFIGIGIFRPKQLVFGADMAGQVEAVGSAVTKLRIGDEVFGSAIGGFAEYACYRESKLALKSAKITFEQAAAVPVAGLTALQSLRDHARVKSGQTVLINGASGGVGTFAVQIAKLLGAYVTGVCSKKNVELVKSLGADQVIDYTKEDFLLTGKCYDVIIDNVANRSILKLASILNPHGVCVVIGYSPLRFIQQLLLQPFFTGKKGKKITGMLANVNEADLTYLKEQLEAGTIVPVIEKQYAFSETADAIRHVEAGHTRGKVVITVP